jgi:putative ABC transport system permease protein
MVSLARKNLLHDRLRFVITVSGVAFAVTLVLVQVGLFMGLLAKATVTIEQRERGHLGHVARHAERGLRARLPGDERAARARRPGVARADNLLVHFMNIQLPSGAEEGASSTPSRTSALGPALAA